MWWRPRAPGVLPHLELQPYVVEAATLCGGGRNPMWWRLQPYVVEAAADLREPARLALLLPPEAGGGLPETERAERDERRRDEVCSQQPQRGRLGEMAERPEHKLAKPEGEKGHTYDVQADGQPRLLLGGAQRREHEKEADLARVRARVGARVGARARVRVGARVRVRVRVRVPCSTWMSSVPLKVCIALGVK